MKEKSYSASESFCPLCLKPSNKKVFPFCSQTCEYIDLGAWLRGEYIVPGTPLEEESDEINTDFEEF
ncbi:MAG: DNA gyrase inhibitor YacG [Holosporales bacterium]|jgi:endogenous inhibitor of DNA gyrase (YacG/DUF329 family)